VIFYPKDYVDLYIADKPYREHGIVLTRIYQHPNKSLQTQTNVPHLAIMYSPTGYSWGYSGSGPQDLSLNILELFLLIESYRVKE